jgi:hypothetical protein
MQVRCVMASPWPEVPEQSSPGNALGFEPATQVSALKGRNNKRHGSLHVGLAGKPAPSPHRT